MTDYLQFAEQQTLNCYNIGLKNLVPQQFLEMLLQNKPWIHYQLDIKNKSFVFLAQSRVR